MKSANPRNAPVIRPRQPTFCRCVCWRRAAAAAAAADSFIVLFSRGLMDFWLTTSEFLHRLAAHRLSITQSHVTPGGGRPGLLRAAATGRAAQTQSQHQDQQKTPPRPEPSRSFSSAALPLRFRRSPSHLLLLLLLLLMFLQVCSAHVVPPSWSLQPWLCAVWASPLRLTERRTSTRTRTWTWSCGATSCCSELATPGSCRR